MKIKKYNQNSTETVEEKNSRKHPETRPKKQASKQERKRKLEALI